MRWPRLPAREFREATMDEQRRKFLLGAGLAGTAVATGLAPPAPTEAQAQTLPAAAPAKTASASEPEPYLTLTANEAAFFSAAADTIIPADELSPSGTQCGVVTFIDRQLAGAWGGGAKMYRSGPFRPAKPEYGYQLQLTPQEREEALKTLEQGKAELVGFNGKQFFEALLRLNMEGFFSDPIHGGNRDKVSWKMIGFPGLPATYRNVITQYRNKTYKQAPQSIADFS